MPNIQADKLRTLCTDIFVAAGAPREESEIIVDNLIRTNLRGVDSHGVRAIPRYVQNVKKGTTTPGAPIKVLRETKTTAMWDNNNGFGFVAGRRAWDRRCGHSEQVRG